MIPPEKSPMATYLFYPSANVVVLLKLGKILFVRFIIEITTS